jgi:hypothetical protein
MTHPTIRTTVPYQMNTSSQALSTIHADLRVTLAHPLLHNLMPVGWAVALDRGVSS